MAARRLDASARWADELRGGGHGRDEALLRLRAHLAAAAHFELGRRGMTGGGERKEQAARLVRDTSEAALARVLADLGRYGGQSAFATWTAKYAIREVAAAARARGSAARLPESGAPELRVFSHDL